MRLVLTVAFTLAASLPFCSGALAAPRPVAAPKNYTISGTITGGVGYTIQLLFRSGVARSVSIGSSGRFSFPKVPSAFAKGATLQLVGPTGTYYGPVVLSGKGRKTYVAFTGKLEKGKKAAALGAFTLEDGYAVANRPVPAALIDRKTFIESSAGIPLGAGKSGLVPITTAGASASILAAETVGGSDFDRDGIPSAYDFDDDGDLNLDSSDGDTAASSAAENPFTTLYLGLSRTLNQNVGAGLTTTAVDAVIGGQDLFALIFFLGLPPGSTVNGGHVICGSGLTYCAQGTGTAIYSGVSESNSALRGQRWIDITTNGSGYPNLEYIASRQALVAGIQPRTGTSALRPGDVYQIVLTAGGSVVESRPFALSPYFVSVPALSVYNAGVGAVTVDYSSESLAGGSPSNPIQIQGDGRITLRFWRPQRTGVPGADIAPFMDQGNLNYGIIIGGLSSEFTCGGFYSSLEGLTEGSSLGNGGSPLAQDGANLWPLADTSPDAVPSTSRTLSMTVDIKGCLQRSGQALGTHQIVLTAAGAMLSGGANRAGQVFYVNVS